MFRFAAQDAMEKERQADDLLNAAAVILADAIDNYNAVQRKSSELDVATQRLQAFVDNRTDENRKLRPLVQRAMDHALRLQGIADGLET